MSGEFSYPLFGCFEDCGLCIITYFAPCYTVGKTAEAIGEDCLMCGVGYLCGGCIVGGLLRGKIREQKGIEGTPLNDFLMHWCCPFCAIIQDNREVVGPTSSGESMARV